VLAYTNTGASSGPLQGIQAAVEATTRRKIPQGPALAGKRSWNLRLVIEKEMSPLSCRIRGPLTVIPALPRNAVQVGKTANTQGDRKEIIPAVKAVNNAT